MTAHDLPNAQEAHYEAIHDAYEAHYYDQSSMAYRHRFIYRPLFAGLKLDGASVADLACGSGHNSLALRHYFPSVRTTGYDISESACRDYRLRTGSVAHQIDLTREVEPAEIHDAALIIGGLHHCVADLDTTLKNVARMLRPGGRFLMMEPSEDFFLSAVRRIWYKKDRWFEAETEAALVHDELSRQAAPYFVPERVLHVGGPAFYLILNSLVTRVPLKLKPRIAPPLFAAESLYNKLPGRAPFAVFLAEWRRTETPT
ncbi:class I SAM-dependent methyltransferase [Mesorhizobium sp. BAC0120]|uniref:class I SAM-dependent methyltransferase n=1 Tax=Mesorhizobium sp. BAC0120 TaxID=3090670 RepID=UPI00298BD819|nr:class I SAM-dependent methyltransferase [Mesorhizobium sp. BAC0120]MDW6020957.1 class I SAM-dependent methyltransferase [Mesorhizobium sp. BAC0120]